MSANSNLVYPPHLSLAEAVAAVIGGGKFLVPAVRLWGLHASRWAAPQFLPSDGFWSCLGEEQGTELCSLIPVGGVSFPPSFSSRPYIR